jgi:hypothetical protein
MLTDNQEGKSRQFSLREENAKGAVFPAPFATIRLRMYLHANVVQDSGIV